MFGVGVVGRFDVDGERPHLDRVALRYLAELAVVDPPLAGPVLLRDDLVAGIAGVVIGTRVREDGRLARAVDVVEVLVAAEHGVGRRDVLGVERHRNHPDGVWRFARPQVGVDEHRRPVIGLQDEPVTTQIPDCDRIRVGVLDVVQ